MHTDDSGTPEYQPDWDTETEEAPEKVERQLAHYAFTREERDREVRLFFRDVPAPEIAQAFFAAGAMLISIGGERMSLNVGVEPQRRGGAETDDQTDDSLALNAEARDRSGPRRRRKRGSQRDNERPQGELVVHYFFALGETVYTVSISTPSGVAGSVAGIYPGAKLPERELYKRLGAVFT